ncbi:lytic murein transglycosylase [Desulfovibrio sp. OttesenSCG-928-I05]|nr:lytic murein transglycosylase [Desulfovibrio sp. OttesenSCG-928-I05]
MRTARTLCFLLCAVSMLCSCASREAPLLSPPLPQRADAFPPHETLRVWAEAPSYPRPAGFGDRLPPVPETWGPLLDRLKADGLDGEDLRLFFTAMGDSYSSKPMGTKITELYTSRYVRKPQQGPRPAIPADRVYPGFVTPGIQALCRAFLDSNELSFTIAEELYHVPREVIVALLMVETKLGTYLGKDSAFWSLACMASADSPERVAEPINSLPGVTNERLAWISEKLTERSTWAYKELKALLEHIRKNNLDPFEMPGSVYGAIGMCQFMPSNLKPYAVDGDKNGVVNLFEPADAIPSVANYLRGHGWKKSMTRDQQHAVIKRYNNSTVYANTILALGESLRAQ